MEQLLLGKLNLLQRDASSEPHTLLRALASCRAVISNTSSSESAACAAFDALVRFLDNDPHPSVLRHAIKLLGDAAAVQRSLSPPAVAAVLPFLGRGERLAAEALSVLVSVGESGGVGFSLIRSAMDERLVLSLASSRAVAVRSTLLRLLVADVERGGGESLARVRPDLVLGVFLGLTADLYPSTRSAALDGLVLCTTAVAEIEASVTERCYDVAAALLHDVDTSVRVSAIRAVSELGGMLVATKEGRDNGACSDALFLLLCSLARDMDMKVRVEVLVALGKIKFVSENILLQSLSKKVLRINNRGKLLSACNVEESRPSLSCAAGVFVHGLEDEFHEVRRVACDSLQALTILSAKFADTALNFLMDMLNDDSTAVQLQTLQTLAQMATYDNLNVQEIHMHMFLGTLVSNNTPVRCAARKVIQTMKLPSVEIFRSAINGLLMNLEMYPEDEGDIFKALFCVSKNHGGLAPNITIEFIQEINPTCLGELNLDRPRVAALLVLALSSSFSNTKLLCDIPARIFSYAVPLLGRISHSLRDFMSQDTLLVYLCKLSGLPCPVIKSDSEEGQMKESETTYEELTVSASNQILRMAAETWPMIKTQCTREALRTLRACKEELEMIATSVNTTCRACLVFTLQYVQVIQVIAEVWEQMQSNAPHLVKMRNLDLLLEKLEISLGTMKFCFPGLSKEEECHVLELALLGCVLRLSKVGIWADPLVRKMQLTISRLELLYCETSDLPNFVKELKELCSRVGINGPTVCSDICDLLKHFSLEQKMFSWKFRHTKAELQVLTDDTELPLPFVPGLPVGLKFHVILYDVSNDNRVWLRMAVGESIQYAFLNLSQFNCSDFERRCTVSIPFYGTPKAAFFMLKACVCLECPGEYVTETRNGCGGPRCRIIFLCEEKDIYLADVDKIE